MKRRTWLDMSPVEARETIVRVGGGVCWPGRAWPNTDGMVQVMGGETPAGCFGAWVPCWDDYSPLVAEACEVLMEHFLTMPYSGRP